MPPPSAAIGTKEAARDLLEEILKDPNIPPEEADFMRDYINRRLHGWCFIMVNVVGKAMACFDRGAIIIKPQLWFDRDVTVWYKSVRAGVVKQAAGGDYYVCLLSIERDGQSFFQQCSRSDSIDQGADVVAHRFWLLNETPEVT